jgi:hypothetical protein
LIDDAFIDAFDHSVPISEAPISAAVRNAAQTGKRAAANVTRSGAVTSASRSTQAAQVAQSVIPGAQKANDLRLKALGLALGGVAAGYSYGRSRRRKY